MERWLNQAKSDTVALAVGRDENLSMKVSRWSSFLSE